MCFRPDLEKLALPSVISPSIGLSARGEFSFQIDSSTLMIKLINEKNDNMKKKNIY